MRIRDRWLVAQLEQLHAPQTLTERNWVQMVLADSYSVLFKVSKLEAVETISPLYAKHFPH